jgi:hypothetical protein
MPPSSLRRYAPCMFRPRGFAPPRRFAPLAGLRVCCAPLPDWGSPRFRCPRTSLLPRRTALARGAFPATRFTPFEEFPSPAASTASLRPVAFLLLPAQTTVESSRNRAPQSFPAEAETPRACLPPRRGVLRDPGHSPELVMLRSAEADPHVTERAPPSAETGGHPCNTAVHPWYRSAGRGGRSGSKRGWRGPHQSL